MSDRTITKRPRGITRALASVAVLALPIGALVTASTASAATPVFPDNVVVFPDRDFVSVEGYERYAGQLALVEVTRGGEVMGSARVPVSGTDVAFEVNHPGGFCWGHGTSLDVTPDIRSGDVVSVTFPDGDVEETVTSSATVTGDLVRDGSTITVEGRFGPEVNPAFLEQRIINPDLVDLIGKRDVRALPGPLVPAPRGGYSSGMLVDAEAGTFVATYQFDALDAAQTAAAADLGERAMSWQVEDADGNRQGLTIAEFGEAGGPGMGGCPSGPGGQEAPAGSAIATYSPDKSSVLVKWNPVAAQPGAPSVDGFSIEAIADPSDADGNNPLTGVRTDAGKTQVRLSNLDPSTSYSIEVRSITGPRLSAPFDMTGGAGSGDGVPPTLEVEPALNGGVGSPVQTNSVTLTSNGQVFFTTDGSPVVSGNAPSDSAQFYTGPIQVTAPLTLKVVAFDAANNTTGPLEGTFEPVPPPAPPAAPTGLTGVSTQSSVALSWADAGDPSITGYRVTVLDAAGNPLASQPPVTTIRSQTVRDLAAGTTYAFEVRAINAGGASQPSDRLRLDTQPLTDSITISSARWKANDFRVVGTGSRLGETIQLHRVTSTGDAGAAIAGATGTVVAAAPPGIGDWDIRLRNGVANPGRVIAVSSGGGVAGPFTVTTR